MNGKEKFGEKIKDLLAHKRADNSLFFNKKEGEILIQKMKAVKEKPKKDKSNYHKLARFDVLVIGKGKTIKDSTARSKN